MKEPNLRKGCPAIRNSRSKGPEARQGWWSPNRRKSGVADLVTRRRKVEAGVREAAAASL